MPNMKIIEMGGRPGTPSRERLEVADLLIHQDAERAETNPAHVSPWDQPGDPNPSHHDIIMLLQYVDIRSFSRDAHQEFGELDDAEQINSNIDMLDLAGNGTDQKFIGMLIDRRNDRFDDAGEPDNQEEEDDGIIITCLYRDPEWVGLNEQLKFCQGMEIHVFSYRDEPQEPHVIIAVRPGYMEDSQGQTEPQGDLNKAIWGATMWHRATSCAFHAIDEDQPQDEEKEEQPAGE